MNKHEIPCYKLYLILKGGNRVQPTPMYSESNDVFRLIENAHAFMRHFKHVQYAVIVRNGDST